MQNRGGNPGLIVETYPLKRRLLGWFVFDWASQPYLTLLLTFIFAPYFAEIVAAKFVSEGIEGQAAAASAQAIWATGLTISGLLIAVGAPVLGAISDSGGRKMPFIYVFSLLYFVGACGLWLAHPDTINVPVVLCFFLIGLIGMEFATIFTNAMLPGLGPPEELGRISGRGWAIGYCGGLLALTIALTLFSENAEGRTLIGISPIAGLDPAAREGTRFVAIFVAFWFAIFMIPFFLWVKDENGDVAAGAPPISKGLSDLKTTVLNMPTNKNLFAFLGASMFYRDALGGMYAFGGLYTVGVLGWSVVDVGIFGIVGVLSGAIACWVAGNADSRFGPKVVIVVCIIILTISAVLIVSTTPTTALWQQVSDAPVLFGLSVPDAVVYFAGVLIGAAGGAIQAASRTMMVHLSDENRMTEAFGLYALAGKATSFLAPALIAIATTVSGSPRYGVSPILGLFLIGLFLMYFVRENQPLKRTHKSLT